MVQSDGCHGVCRLVSKTHILVSVSSSLQVIFNEIHILEIHIMLVSVSVSSSSKPTVLKYFEIHQIYR